MPNPTRKTFVRVADSAKVHQLLAEARRVRYTVERAHGFPLYKVTDPDHAGALVFKAVQVNPTLWAITYATDYWQEPAMVSRPTPRDFANHIKTQPAPA